MGPYLKFRLQRQLRRWRRDLIQTRHGIANYFDLHIWGRWRQLGIIRRFVVVWWLVFVIAFLGSWQQLAILNLSYQVLGPAPGGVYVEGLVGTVKSINPVLPEGSASLDVARLIFNGLTQVDPSRQIVSDLADAWTVSSDGTVYTFHLHSGVKWQDGKPFTASDVAYTIGLIQNPDTRSPLASSWLGVKVTTPDDQTVVFTLPGADVGFISSTTVGIVPKHLLEQVSPAQLRVADFNQHPVGTGPFKLDDVNGAGTDITLVPNKHYFAGAPQLDQFVVKLFDSDQAAQRSYAQRQLTAIGHLPETADTTKLGLVRSWPMNLASEVGVFMRTTGVLADKVIRQAIAGSLDRQALATAAGQVSPNLISEPILPGQIGYTAKYAVPKLDRAAANAALEADGWVRGKDGWRRKGGQILKLKVATSTASGYQAEAKELENELQQIGIQLDMHVVDTSELQQTYIRPRNYDLLLFGISIGADSDVYTYWHSSQVSDPGLNLSQYNSSTVDRMLEGARLTSDTAIRVARYDKFLATWTADVPAVMLYQPEYLYATRPEVMGIVAYKLVDPSDRFYNVQNWTVNTRLIQKR